MAALLGLVPPFLGPIVYLFVRPHDSIEERRDRELENRALEERLAERDLRCPVCRGQVDASFLVCPVCTTRLKQACASCGSPLEPIWQVCPYCATTVPPAAASRATTCCSRSARAARADRRSGRRRAARGVATTLPPLWPPKPHSSSSSRTASGADSAARSSPASSVAATSCAAPACSRSPAPLAQQHYAEHKGKPFFGELVSFITSGPVLALAVRGENAIAGVRAMMGATNPADSAPGTIRGDYATLLSENIVHGSDSKASARRELSLFFPDGLL